MELLYDSPLDIRTVDTSHEEEVDNARPSWLLLTHNEHTQCTLLQTALHT